MDCNNVAVGRHKEMQARIIAANKAFYSHQTMFTSKQITEIIKEDNITY
jgi:hypothetical protein